MPSLILASNSPRRKHALKRLHIPFIAAPTSIDEEAEIAKSNGDPQSVVLLLSRLKAESVADQYPDRFILGMDTIVVANRRIIGKPRNETEAFHILCELNAKWHEVITGLTLYNRQKEYVASRTVCTKVKFHELTEEEITSYIATGESLDKAGAYGIQSAGRVLVKEVDGDFSNVVGFPEQTVISMLKQAGFPLPSVQSK
jgi:septum formation protein